MTPIPEDPSAARFADDAGRYRLEARIATGGMGEVWRAHDNALGREVAIKLLKPEFAGDPVFRTRFEGEARHAAVLHHPGIAAVYDVGEGLAPSGDPRPYLVMELVDGRPLSALIRRDHGMDPDAVRDLIGQAGEALAAAHAAGIVHRDVKPANLLVTPDRTVKVTDFGIARALAGATVTGTGAVMGTPQYLSPEQARGETATPASDVYGLGVVAYECLAGRRPFDKETAVATALAHLNDPVPPLPDTVPPELAAVVMRALSKRPAERYPDAGALAAAIRGGGVDEAATAVVPPVVAPPASAPATQVMGPVPPTAATPLVASGPPVPPGPHRDERAEDGAGVNPWLIAAAAAVAIALVFVVWLLMRGGPDKVPAPTRPTPSTSASAPTTTPSTPSTQAPRTVQVDPADYVGRDIDQVLAQLRSLGLRPSARRVDNPGDQPPDTVAALSPTGELAEGDAIEVAYYGDVVQPSTPAPSEPTQQTTPPSSQPTPTPTGPATPTASTPATAETGSTTAGATPTPAAREDIDR